MEEISIGEFARRSRLSVKALRLYDEQGLLNPARVDASSGYRYYELAQLEDARLIAMMRQLDMALASIKVLLAGTREDAATSIAEHWRSAETTHGARRELARYLVDQLNGKKTEMYEVGIRDIPERSILCLKRNADEAGVWALGKEFIAIMRERPLPRLEGRAGAFFCIFWGEVSADSDGPVEFCRPISSSDATAVSAHYPEFVLRTEPAHQEAFVAMESGSYQWGPAETQLAMESLHAWAMENGVDQAEHELQPEDLGVRMTYLTHEPVTATSVPDCDFAVPFKLTGATLSR